MLNCSEINKAITDYRNSNKYKIARKGLKYYEGEHDILKNKMYFINSDGLLQEDTTKANIKISHPFFTELVDQKVSYFLDDSETYVKSDIPELQNILNEYFNDQFTAELLDALTYGSVEGFSYLYRSLDETGKSVFNFADGLEVVELLSKNASDKQDHMLYCGLDKFEDGKVYEVVLDFTAKEITYYKRINNTITLDDRYAVNPKPAILYKSEGEMFFDEFADVPFYRFTNNRKEFSDLKPVKPIIDDADLMSCALSNNLEDLTEGIVMVSGFQGSSMDELLQNIKTRKAIGVSEDGSVQIQTVDIPYEARKVKYDMDKENIYKFGFGFDSSQGGDGNITNVVIKSRYTLLDMKCSKFEIQVKKFLREILKTIIEEINKIYNTGYSINDIYFEFKRNGIVDRTEEVANGLTLAQTKQIEINNILALTTTIDKELRNQLIAEQLDLDYEEFKDHFVVDEQLDLNTLSEELAAAPIEE